MKETKTISAVKSYSIENPSEVVKMANVLKNHIVGHNLYTNIKGKNYVHVEGWQFAGGMLGLFPQVVDVKNVGDDKVFKYEAKVNIVNMKTNQIVSTGYAMCSKSESKKASFDEYAVMSMSQTRAIGKAYRNIIGWVMKLAGYQGTPSEEMTKMGENHEESPVTNKPQSHEEPQMFECSICGDRISAAGAKYSMNLYGKYLCKTHAEEAKPKKKK